MDGAQVATLVVSSSVLAAAVSGLVTYLVNRRTLTLQETALNQQRLTETSRLMVDLTALAHGAPVDGRTHIGAGQQLAAIAMIEIIGRSNPEQHETARTFLANLADEAARRGQANPDWLVLRDAASAAHTRLSPSAAPDG